MSNIRKMAEQYFEDAVELRRRIHQQPELSMEEKETSALVREKLREYGISIAELPLETGVIGVLAGERPGRTILLRADMDALPVEERSGLPFTVRDTLSEEAIKEPLLTPTVPAGRSGQQ